MKGLICFFHKLLGHAREYKVKHDVVFHHGTCQNKTHVYIVLVCDNVHGTLHPAPVFEKADADAIGGGRQGGGGRVRHSCRCGHSSLGEEPAGVIISF